MKTKSIAKANLRFFLIACRLLLPIAFLHPSTGRSSLLRLGNIPAIKNLLFRHSMGNGNGERGGRRRQGKKLNYSAELTIIYIRHSQRRKKQ
jgi:hypothetical protein